MLASILIFGSLSSIQPAEAGGTVTHNLESCFNGATFMVQGEIGTAGTLGVDYALGTHLAGGGQIGHGFGNAYNFLTGHFILPGENGFVSTPSVDGATGALEDADHNWLQGTTAPVVVDLGADNEADQAIVFNSIDHLSGASGCDTDAEKLWDAMVEGIEFTVYATNDAVDAAAVAAAPFVFNPLGNNPAGEAGSVPGAGTGSSFEQGTLDYVFNDGWMDFEKAQEGDDFASVWQFSKPYQFIAVFSHFTDPFPGDGFQSFDNELDAIGRFLQDVGEPCTGCPPVGGEFLQLDTTSLLLAGAQTFSWMIPVVLSGIGIGLFVVSRKSE